MAFIRYTLRRNREKLKMIGWAVAGFILLFCILTVQLSATERESPKQSPAAKRLPSPAQVDFNTGDRAASSLEHLERPTSKNSMIPIAPAFLATGAVSQASHTFPASTAGADHVPPPSPYTYSNNVHPTNTYPNNPYSSNTQNLIPDPSTSPAAVYLQHQPTSGEVIYTESQAMPRSNYFGVGPDDVCDEWSGFCNCKQKMFTRRGEACSDKACRLKRGRNCDDCGCGN